MWSRVLVLESLLKLNSLDVLLVLDFFFDVLVSLKKLIVFGLSQLQSLIQVGLELFLEGVHLVLLLPDELGPRRLLRMSPSSSKSSKTR